MNLKERILQILGRKGISAETMSEAELGDAISKLFDSNDFAEKQDLDDSKQKIKALETKLSEIESKLSALTVSVNDAANAADAKLSKVEGVVANLIGKEKPKAEEKSPEAIIEELMNRVEELEKSESEPKDEYKHTANIKIKK